jgi:DNA invertase Pin-like site-specific DNA recombinase
MQAGESESIQNQKIILQRYADDHHFFNTRFFVDDGFSGVSFEREGLQAMLREVEAGNVAAVITKDLSRLGRNYLKTGELIEIIFPEYDVRYIAINDGVDTAREDNEFTPLRNWFNEFYARDTSKKIRAVKLAKAQRGERVNGEAPYGYLIDPEDKNHLIPDPETAHVVKRIFAMYVRGDRMCEIQNWLRDNEILTVGELRYRRTGRTQHPRPQLNAWYNWPDKTLYDILTRQEYLGHTITAKTYKVSYKSKKTRKNAEDKRYFFPNTHEPLIDEETFALAQKRIATRHRPTKSDEIDLFSGLLFCGDCGYKMYLQKGAGTPERKHAYTCGNYRNRARNDFLCTTHYIRKSVLKELVLADLQRIMSYVKGHEQEFIQTATECSEQAMKKALGHQRKELDKAEARLGEINLLFRKLYEDNALGRLSNEQFVFLTSGYEDEKRELTKRAAELKKEIDTAAERSADVKRFVALVRRYTEISELTYENVHEFIDRILIYELDKNTNTRKIEIFYSFVGKVDTGDQPTESVSYFRQIGADVKSVVV